MPQKGQKEGVDLQCNALTSLVHFQLVYNCTKWIRDVSALHWRSYTCFCPFVAVLINYPVFSLHTFQLCMQRVVCNSYLIGI